MDADLMDEHGWRKRCAELRDEAKALTVERDALRAELAASRDREAALRDELAYCKTASSEHRRALADVVLANTEAAAREWRADVAAGALEDAGFARDAYRATLAEAVDHLARLVMGRGGGEEDDWAHAAASDWLSQLQVARAAAIRRGES